MKYKSFTVALLTGVCVSTLGSGVSFAKSDDNGLEEIMVTAQRRTENLQRTPIAITALDSEALERRGIANIQEAITGMPNVDLNTGDPGGGSTNAQIYIRGIGQNDFIIVTDPGVGIYIDNVYYARTTGGLLDLADIQRVEVLRGPQGALYGRNTIGGAINITTMAPTSDFGGMVDASYGSYNHVAVRGMVNIPVAEGLAVRASTSFKRADGFVHRVVAGDRLGGYDSLAGRLRALWTVNDRLTVDIAVDATRARNDGSPQYLAKFVQTGNLVPLYMAPFVTPVINRPASAAGSAAVDSYIAQHGRLPVLVNSNDPYTSYGTGPNVSNLDTWGLSAQLTYKLSDDLQIKSITGYRKMSAYFGQDGDNTPYQYIQTLDDVNDKTFSQELQFSGSTLNNRLKFVSGLYYFNEAATDQNNVRLLSGLYGGLESLPAAIIPLGPVTCPAALPAPCAGGAGNPVNTSLDLDFFAYNHINTDSYAAFAHVTYDLTDAFSAVVGLRYTRDEKTYFLHHTRFNSGVDIIPPTTVSRADKNVSPKFGLNYQINDQTMTYVSATRGFKSGGFNGRPTTESAVSSFGPEYVWTYELGLKTEFLDRHVRLNSALFWNDYKDIQLSIYSADNTGNLVLLVENAGKARMRGFEIESSVLPAKGWLIDASLAYLDAKYTALNSGATIPLDNKLARSPKWMASAGVSYSFLLTGDLQATIRGDWHYRSSLFNNPENTPELKSPGLHLFDARVTLASEKTGLQITVYGKNITDQRYITGGLQALSSFGEVAATLGRPREWGVTMKKTF